MREQIRECERAAYADGLATGLALALDGVDVGAPPGSVAAVPSTWVTAEERVIPNAIAREAGISFLRCPGRATPAPRLTALGARLGAVRLGVSRRLAERVVRSLSGRVAGGEPIIRKQLVAGTLAGVRTETEVLRACLLTTGSAAAVADVHDRLTAMDWELAKLLGASGYAGAGHAGGAHASRLTANCWVPREATGA